MTNTISEQQLHDLRAWLKTKHQQKLEQNLTVKMKTAIKLGDNYMKGYCFRSLVSKDGRPHIIYQLWFNETDQEEMEESWTVCKFKEVITELANLLKYAKKENLILKHITITQQNEYYRRGEIITHNESTSSFNITLNGEQKA